MPKEKEESKSPKVPSKPIHSVRIQTAEGWKRSQLKKHKPTKGASKG